LAQEIEQILPELVDTAKGIMFVNYNAFIAILIKGFNEQQTNIELLQNTIVIQELEIIELRALRETVIELKKIVESCCEKSKGDNSYFPDNTKNQNETEKQEEPKIEYDNQEYYLSSDDNNLQVLEKAKLFQNTPNPFSMNTEIRFEIPESATSSKLLIHDMQGAEIKSYNITDKGVETIVIQGSELQAGMYMYTLLVNNRIVDTKKMLLTK